MAQRTWVAEVSRKQKLAFGMEWYIPPGLRDIRAERRAIVQAGKSSHVLTLQADRERPLIGTALGLARGTRVHSASALFAQHMGPNTAVLVFDLGKNRAGLVAVRSGRPVVGFDDVVTHELARVRIAEFSRLIGSEVPVYGNLQEVDGCEAFDLQVLFKNAEAVKCARLTPATLPVKLLVAGAVSLTFTATAFLVYQHWEAQEQEEQRKLQQTRPVDPNIQYRQMLPNFLIQGGARAEGLPELLQAAKALPVAHEGWWLSRALCIPGQCQVDWKVNGGTFEAFEAKPLVGATSLKFNPDFKGISQTFSAPDLATLQGVKEEALLDEVAYFRDIGTTVQSAQAAQLDLTLQASSIVALPGGAVESQIKNPVRSGTWSMKGRLWTADFPAAFPAGTTIESIEINIPVNDPGAANVDIKGKYYVKS